jgi:large subunit ribosomal protein L21
LWAQEEGLSVTWTERFKINILKRVKETMYAIVEIGGKQYRVEKDMTINVSKLSTDGDELKIERVLLCADGENVLIGQPYLENVKVTASVIGDIKGKKVRGVKFKKRKNYTRTLGYRPEYTTLKINEVAIV